MKEVITSIRKVSIELSKWTGYATAMIDKIELDEIKVPQNSHSCEFGKWYAKDEWNLSNFDEFPLIGIHHVNLHNLYNEMMELVQKEQKPSFFKKLTGASFELSKPDKKILLKKYQAFKSESKIVLSLLKDLQKTVKEKSLTLEMLKVA